MSFRRNKKRRLSHNQKQRKSFLSGFLGWLRGESESRPKLWRRKSLERLEDRQVMASTVFANAAAITINDDANATPYPSTINVAGLQGTITNVTVDILGLSHTFPDDIDMLLASPVAGNNAVIMSDAGGEVFAAGVSNVNLTFSDSAAGQLPDDTNFAAGTYQLSNFFGTADVFSGGAPAPSASTTLATAFGGISANGAWNLYVVDDASPDTGSISGGWRLNFRTSIPVIDATDTGGNGQSNGNPDSFRLVRSGANLEVFVNGILSRSQPYSEITSIVVNGSNDIDTLEIDQTGGVIDRPITFNGSGANDILTITGSGNNEDISLSLAGITINGTGLYSVVGIETLNVNGGLGDDTLTVDFTGSSDLNPLPEITFNGGVGGNDSMVLQGGDFATGESTPSGFAPGDGDILYAGGFNSGALIHYTGLEPIIDSNVVGIFTVLGTAAPETIDVTTVGGATRVSSLSFEMWDLTNKATIVVDPLGGDDIVNVNLPTADAALTTLTIGNQGDNANVFESNTTNILATPNGVIVNITNENLSNLNDTLNIGATGGAGSVQNILGSVNITNNGSFTDLTVNNETDVVPRTITMTEIMLSGIAPAPITYTAFDLATMVVNGGSGNNTYDVQSGLASGSGNTTTFNGGAGDDTFNIDAANLDGVAVNPNNNAINNFNGLAGNDIFNVTGFPVDNNVVMNINGAMQTTEDVVNVDAQGAVVTFDGMTLSAPGLGSFAYVGIETLNITNTAGVIVNGTGVNDTFTLSRTASATVPNRLQGPAGYPTLNLPTNTGLQVVGLAGSDSLVINETVNGLPIFTVQAPGAHTNAPSGAALASIGLNFDGSAGGSDSIDVNLISQRNVGYFSDNVTAANSGVITIVGGTTLSFTNLAPISVTGVGGTLTVDATGTPATTTLNISDAMAAGDGISQVTGDGGFETTTFDGFTTLVVRGGPGGETISLNNIDTATSLTSITMDGDDTTNTDASVDSLAVVALPAAVTVNLLGGAGDDIFAVGGFDFTSQDILGQVNVSNSADEAGGADLLAVVSLSDPLANNMTVTSTTIDGVSGFVGAPDIQYGGGDQIETIQFFDRNGTLDVHNFQSTRLGSAYQLILSGFGLDTINVSSDAPTNLGNLNAIDGAITISSATSTDSLFVSDLGDATADTYILDENAGNGRLRFNDGAAANDIQFNLGLGNFNLQTSNAGSDTLLINATSGTVANTIRSGGGNDAWTITGSALSAANSFDGEAGNDDFVLNITNNLGSTASTAITSLAITGGSNPAANSNNRDRVTINDNPFAPRSLNFDYQNVAGSLNVAPSAVNQGLFGATGGGNLALNLLTMETVIFNSTVTNTMQVSGTSGADDITVALEASNTSALVFLGGAPYTGTPPVSLANALPGVAGGGAGPDLALRGIDLNGLTLDGEAGANRAIVQAASENAVVAPGATNDAFNLGLGGNVLIPGFGANNAYDAIWVNGAFGFDPDMGFSGSAANQVLVRNIANGQLTPVQVVPGSFVTGAPAGLIVNAGDEAAARPEPTNMADNIFAVAHPQFDIAINGNNPGAGVGLDGLPTGDQLNLTSASSFSIWSDKATPPNITVQAGNGPFGVISSSIERQFLNPANGVINLIGDNNTAGLDQNDNFVVRGRDITGDQIGQNEMSITLNGSSPVLAVGVNFLNVFGFDMIGQDLTNPAINVKNDPEAGGVDTLDIRAYADNTPFGWGVHVNFNEGAPGPGLDGDQADLLIYRTSVNGGPVSEAIVVQPTAVDAGQVFSNNSATNTPIVVINYMANTDIQVLDDDGFVTDNDSLTLRGTNPDPLQPNISGNENFNITLTNAGNAVNPKVAVTDGPSGQVIYRVQQITGFGTLHVEPLAGADFIDLTNTATTQVLIDGADGADRVFLRAAGTATVTQSAVSTSGSVTSSLAGPVFYNNLERLDIDGAGTLTVRATDDNDTIAVQPVVGSQGRVWINDGTVLTFNNAAAGFNTLNVAGRFGDDKVSVTPITGVAVNVDGGDPAASDQLVVNGTAGADAVTVTPLSLNSGSVQIAGFGLVSFTTTESLTYAGLGGDDALTVVGTAGSDTITVTPGANADSGTIAVNSLVPFAFQGLGSAAAATIAITDGGGAGGLDRLIYNGKAGDDNFTVNTGGNGVVSYQSDVASILGGTTYVPLLLPTAGNLIEGLVLNGFDGADNFVLNSSALFTLGIAINAGNPTSGSDRVTLNGTAAADTIGLTLGASNDSVTGIVGGPIQLSGVERLTLSTGSGDDAMTVSNLGGPSDLVDVLFASGGDANDTLVANGTTAADAITVTPVNATTARVSANGRGPLVEAILGAAATSTFTVAGGASNDVVTVLGTGSAETIAVVRGATTTVQVGGSKIASITSASSETVVVDAGDGNDTINVSGTATNSQLLNVLGGAPTSNAGAISDQLNVTLATAGTTTATPGASPDAGALTTPDGAIEYAGLEFFSLQGAAGANVLNAQGTHANDSIAAQFLNAANRVWINDRAVYSFAGYQTVNVNGLFGDDKISIAPAGLVGVTTLNVAGGDPTASDEVVINGTVGLDAVTIASLVSDGAQVTGLGGVTINVATAEQLVYSGLGGNDTLTFVTPVANSIVRYTPGAAIDSAAVRVNATIPMRFQGIGAVGTSTIADGGLNGRLIVDGSSLDDFLSISAAGTVDLVNGAGNHVDILFNILNPIENVSLIGLEGEDLFQIDGGNPYTEINIQGGGPDEGDHLDLNAPAAAVTLDFGAASITGYGGTINYTGIYTIAANAVGAAPTFNGSANDDKVNVTLLSSSRGTIDVDGDAPFVTYDNGVVAVQAIVDTGAGEDQLIVTGNSLAQTFAVNARLAAAGPVGLFAAIPAQTVLVDDNNDGIHDGSISWTANNEALSVNGLQGNDVFNVVAGTVPVFIDGGDPIGTSAGDQLNIFAFGDAVAWEAGPETDEGGFQFLGARERVSYDHIEALGAINAACAIIIGTNGDDDITIIARTQQAVPLLYVGANGVQDFTTSVNGGPDLLWIDTPDIHVDALSGDDDIVLRTPAPNNASWNVDVEIAGGPPSAGNASRGDRFQLETPFTDNIVYTPTGSDTGTVLIDDDANGVDSGTDSLITIGSFTADCNNDGIIDYVSSPGGVEHFEYDGEGANDVFAIVGTAADDFILYTPGNGTDEGSLRLNDTLAVTFQNLGLTGQIVVDGAAGNDELDVQGTLGSDAFTVERISANEGTVTVVGHLPVRTRSVPAGANTVEQYTINALEGDDVVTINYPLATGVTTVVVNGGGPSGSDSLIINGALGTAEAIAVTAAAAPTDGNVAVNAVNNPYTGIEHITINANGGDADNLTVTDDGRDNLWTISAGPDVPVLLGTSDRIQIAGRESIDYRGITNVTLNNASGTDRFVVEPTSLRQYAGTFTINGDAGLFVDDSLELVGTPAADVITSTATAVTVNGNAITVGVNLVEVKVSGLAGNDDINLDLALAGVRKVIDAGQGDDVVDLAGIVTAGQVLVYGGDGNDTLIGADILAVVGVPGDTIYGGAGNDTITGGIGNDNLFGGDGSDRFVWDNGDNSDVVEGDEGVDVVVVNGAAAGDAFTLRTATGNQARAFFERTNLVPFTIDMGKVEQVDVRSAAGADVVTVRDLYTTDVREVNVDVGVDADLDRVIVDGRSVSDDVTLTALAGGVVNIAGLLYDVDVANIDSTVDLDTLTFNAREGNDSIVASDGLNAIFGITLANVNHLTINGGEGDDSIIGFGQLNGDAGTDSLLGGAHPQTISGGDDDDYIDGGAGDDILNGNDGEDSFVGGAGNDTIDGGDDWDAILIFGTSGGDIIDVNQTAATTLVHTVNGAAETDTLALNLGVRTVEEARIDAGRGADQIRVQNLDALAVDANVNSLQMTVDGGTHTGAGDRLVVVDNGLNDLTLYRKDQDDAAGTVSVGPGNAESFETVFVGIERVQFLDAAGNVPNTAATASRLMVFKHDPFEYNDDRTVATHVGANDQINVDPTIDPGTPTPDPFGLPGDADWYRVEATVTGTLDLQAFFEEIPVLANGRPGLPGNGDLDIELYDIDGTLIAGNGTFGTNNGANDNNLDGEPDAENERIRIPAVQGQVYYLRVFGRTAAAINTYNLTIVNDPAPTVYGMELLDNPVGDPPPANSDTGRSQFDDVTRDNTPTLVFRLDDGIFRHDMPGNPANSSPPDEVITIPFQTGAVQPTSAGFAIAIFDEGNSPAPGTQTGTAPQTFLGFATAVAGQEGVYQFTTPTLVDGSHFLSARVQMIDPSNTDGDSSTAGTQPMTGYAARSTPLEIIVDTVTPPNFFGLINAADTTQGLSAASDSGINGYPATNVDRISNDTTPTFFGTAEADTIVRVWVERNGVAGLQSGAGGDLYLGQTTATPLDGSNQFPNGYWTFTSEIDLNNPSFFTQDGLRRIYVTGEDLAGNVTPDANADTLNIFLDTQGPNVTRVDVNTRNNLGYNIFDHKARPDGGADGYLVPSPLVNSVVISVRDLPLRSNADANFLYDALFAALATEVGNYKLVGDANGIIPISSVTFTADAAANGVQATGFVTLTFFEPLPDDRFTLTMFDAIADRVGNKLDGESQSAEPHDGANALLPSGDGEPGGSFVARFTVDTRPEIGTYDAGAVYVDTNGNFLWDTTNNDFVNRDIQYAVRHLTSNDKFFTSDDIFAGNFTSAGVTPDGFDKLGAYGQDATGAYRWLIDTNNDGVAERYVAQPGAINGLPVIGNWDNNPANGDEVGLFDGSRWYLDTDGNLTVNAGFATTIRGLPIGGDFDGDGRDDLAAWTDDRFQIDLANDGFGDLDATISFGFIGERERPVAADMDHDGIDDLGLWVPDRAGQNPQQSAEWYFLVSADPTGALRQIGPGFVGQARVNTLDHAFKPFPFGRDMHAIFGNEYALPIIGNFDPPADATPSPTNAPAVHTNPQNALDVDGDGIVAPSDVLYVINFLNSEGAKPAGTLPSGNPYLDADADGFIAASDALVIINYLNRTVPGTGGEGEGEGDAVNESLITATSSATTASQPSAAAALSVTDLVSSAPAKTSTNNTSSATNVVSSTTSASTSTPNVLSQTNGSVASAFTAADELFGSSSLDDVLDALVADQASDSTNESAVDAIFARL